MKLRVLGCSGGQLPGYQLSSLLLDDTLLIDAGSVAAVLDLKRQLKIDHVLVTHVHLDHVFGLGTLADNIYAKRSARVVVWSDAVVIESLRRHYFNDQLWPDFTRIHGTGQPVPVIELRALSPVGATAVGAYSVTAIPVNHPVPSFGFFIERGGKAILHVADTGPTERVWSLARRRPDLCALIVETSFPSRLQDVADASGHLTPQTLRDQLAKLGGRSVPVLVSHLKPEFRREIVTELKALKDPRLRVLRDGEIIRL